MNLEQPSRYASMATFSRTEEFRVSDLSAVVGQEPMSFLLRVHSKQCAGPEQGSLFAILYSDVPNIYGYKVTNVNQILNEEGEPVSRDLPSTVVDYIFRPRSINIKSEGVVMVGAANGYSLSSDHEDPASEGMQLVLADLPHRVVIQPYERQHSGAGM